MHTSFSRFQQSPSHSLNATQTQFKKIFCAYHRTEFLTNFCVEKQCLMPLCPSCVAEHTEYHNKSTHRPTYINLQQALHETKQKLYAMIVNLQDQQNKNEQILSHLNNLPSHLKEQLTSAKEQIFHYIQGLFIQYEQDMLRQIHKKYEECKIYNRRQGQQMKVHISNVIDSLYDKIGLLKGQQCLAALITYYGEDRELYQQTKQQIEQYISRHRKTGKVIIQINQPALTQQLKNLCQKSLHASLQTQNNVAYQPLNENSFKKNSNSKNKFQNSRANLQQIRTTLKQGSRVSRPLFNI